MTITPNPGPKTNPPLEYARYPSLKGKHVLVTGGGTSIGAALTEAFVVQGARVTCVDIADEAAQALIAQLTQTLPAGAPAPRYVHCDLTNLDELSTTLARIQTQSGAVDVLVNNAASDARYTFGQLTAQDWDTSMAVNLRHMVFCAQAVVEGMKAAGGGVILNLGSISWHLALPNLVMYMAAKAGIEGMTRGMARDLGQHLIRVNCIVPGSIVTPKYLKDWHTPELEARILAGQCLQSRVECADIAAMALFLASDQAARCSGREYFVDAGWFGA